MPTRHVISRSTVRSFPQPVPSPAPQSVLVVDDETGVRELMSRWLKSSGYAVVTAADASEALDRMANKPAAVALCDIRMPGRDGLWLAEQLRHRFPETAVIMATGVQDVGSAVTSLRQGVLDYLTKPFGRERLREAVTRAIDWHRAALDSRRWMNTLREENDRRAARLAAAVASVALESDEAIEVLLSLLTGAHNDMYGHAYRVAALTVGICRTLGISEEESAVIERAALLHDLGKLTLPEAILRKPASLNPEEQEIVRRHPAIAADLLHQQPFTKTASYFVRTVSERFDGRGYPLGLRGDDIPLGSRIIAVADAYDNMTRTRIFRDAMPASEALLEMTRCSGSQFDPAIVEIFRRVICVH